MEKLGATSTRYRLWFGFGRSSCLLGPNEVEQLFRCIDCEGKGTRRGVAYCPLVDGRRQNLFPKLTVDPVPILCATFCAMRLE